MEKLTPEQDALEHIVVCRDKPFLEEKYINSFKGRGVFTHKAIEPSTFVVEYRGNIFLHKGRRTQKRCGDTLNNYLFEFSWNKECWCVDASTEDSTLGRLVNDDHDDPNCEIQKIVHEGKPHLCLFAVKEISPGEEITYNYGDSSYPWRSMESCDGSSTPYTDCHATTSTSRNDRLTMMTSPKEVAAPSQETATPILAEDSDSASSFDDDELSESGPIEENDSQMDFSDNSATDLDSSQQMAMTFMQQPCNASFIQHEAASRSDEFNLDEDYGPNKAVQKPKDPSYTSKNYCYICGTAGSKFARHLKLHAKEYPEVAEVFALPDKSKERKKLLEELRNRGNYKHNQEVLRNNSGELKLKRRPVTTFNAKEHMLCPYCKAMYKSKDIWRHIAKKHSNTIPNSTTCGSTRESEIALAESPFSQKLTTNVWRILASMQQDETTSAVQNDFLLIELARSLSEKYPKKQQQDYVKRRLRGMGTLLMALNEKSISSFQDAINPENFYKVVEAVKHIAGFDKKTQSYNKPSLALKLGHSLKKIGAIVLDVFDGQKETVKDAKKFMKLCAKEWRELVSKTAIASLSGQKDYPATIPFICDVQVFYSYLKNTATSAIENLKMHGSLQAYKVLCRVTLAHVSVLNKCGPEVSKMTLKAFQERGGTTKVLSKHLIKIDIQSEADLNVALLLTSELVSAITLLVSKREECCIHPDNPFLFAKPDSSSTSLYRGRNCIRTFSSLCSAKNPKNISSVHLHKHIARVFQILNLENNELSDLAELLGQDMRVDKDYYCLPEAALELAKIAKLLMAMEKGSLETFKGNSLEEIEIEDELEPDVEQGIPEDSDEEEEEEEEESDLLLQQNDAVEQQTVKENQKGQQTAEQDALNHIKAHRDKPYLEERFIDPIKGRGVFTRESIEPSTFVVEYRGTIISQKQTRKRRLGDTLNNYLFDFSWKGTNWCIDASEDDGSLGRLVNDDHESPNCKMRKIVFEGKPHVCLFAVEKISADQEITYSYGDSSYPWRSVESSEEPCTSQTVGKAAAPLPQVENVEDCSSAESCCDDEYVPDQQQSEESSDDSYTSQNSEQQQQKDEAVYNPDDFTSDEETLPPLKRNRNYCYVCGKAQSKISRHLFTHRKEEPDIAAVFALRKNSKERASQLDKLRNRGNYKHNEEVLKTHCGELKVRKRSRKRPATEEAFACCLYCKTMHRRKSLWRHLKKCSSKTSSTPVRNMSKLFSVSVPTDPKEITPDVRKILETLKKDEITSVILNDPHILQLAQCFGNTNAKVKMQNSHFSHRLRVMGRLLLMLREESIGSIEDALKPENLSRLFEAVRELYGYNEEMKTCRRPTVLRSLSSSLKKIGEINLARALRAEADAEVINAAEAFLKKCEKELACVPKSTNKERKTTPTISFIQDVQCLHQYMETTVASGVESLTMYAGPQVYNALLRVILAQLSVFNKNIVEVSKVTLMSFNERDETERPENAAVSQSQMDQILSKLFLKIEAMSNKKVAFTLTPNLLTALELLVSKRETCGINESNPFLFARPIGSSLTFFQGHRCFLTFVDWCGAKNAESLKSGLFHKHALRVAQILSLSNEELDQVAKLLDRGFRTDREYYQTPEAAVDIAKIAELLSALQNGSHERFKGKSFEEIEISDELEQDEEEKSPSDEESENPLKLTDIFSDIKAGSISKRKKLSRFPLARKRGQSRRRKLEDEEKENEKDEASELNAEENKEVNTERDDESEEIPVSCDVNTPEKTVSHSNEDATRCSFSDHDEDMNVDFDMDTDDEDVRNERGDGDDDTHDSTEMPLVPDAQDTMKQDNDTMKTNNSPHKQEIVDADAGNHVEEEDQKKMEQRSWMDVDSRRASAVLNTEQKKKLSAAVSGMKELKILIPRLDLKLQTPTHISQLSSVCSSVKGQPIQDDNKECPTSCISTDITDKQSYAKAMQMTCAHCGKTMMRGQTAYQKKGFTDVFCSKNCLFELFPVNKPVAKTCHYCQTDILNPLDLIMAAVDIKGTMKDFCSVSCLSSFKSNTVPTQTPQSVCVMCNKFCTTKSELTMNGTVYKFCSDSCLEDFRRDTVMLCVTCSSTCHDKPLMLILEGDTKTFCSKNCLHEFKEDIKTPHQCTLCDSLQPMSEMVFSQPVENTVELFCTRFCMTSCKLAVELKLQDTEKSDQLKNRRRSPLLLKFNNEDGNVTSGSAVNKSGTSPAAESNTPTALSADGCVVCCHCGKDLPKGQTLHQPKNSSEVFCSASCLSQRHPHVHLVAKKCYNCFQELTRPHSIILAPVDDSGSMKELCSDTCLFSVNSKRNMTAPKPPPLAGPRSEGKTCNKFCKCRVCLINYHKDNNLPVVICDVCVSVCLKKPLVVKREDSSKTICSDECLHKFKEQMETPQRCPMCQTSHHLSDMVEQKNDEGELDFFCSNRCLLVHKAQTLPVPETKSPTLDDNDIKEDKPSLLNVDFIKEEPIDEDYKENLSFSMCTEDIKDEPKVSKEDLKIGSVFSLTEDSTPTAPILTHMDMPATCSNCKTTLMDGETVYQRKSHTDVFCSTSCLLKFHQMKQVKKTCHFCLQVIAQPQAALQAPGDTEEMMKDFCSHTCLSSFSYKKIMSARMPTMPVTSQSQCSMCSRYCISKCEIILQGTVYKVCSDPCLTRFRNMNNLSVCENCHSYCNTPVVLRVEDGSKKLCSAECLTQFKQKNKTLQLCAMCSKPNLMLHMVENKTREDVLELFCTSSCVMASKIQAIGASGVPLDCDNCGKATVPVCHLAMSDASIRNFCTLSCAMAFKETQNTATNNRAASDQTKCDFLKPPEKLPCAQCQRNLITTPQIIKDKGKIYFVCSLDCSEEFKRINNIMGKCDYCKNEKIIRNINRVNNKDCYFCSDGCQMLFCHELHKKWGEHCRSCAYCLCISKKVVTAQFEGTTEEFCSENCNSKYKMLYFATAKCDACGRRGKLRQRLPMLGEVKHFCDLRCLLHFCTKTVSSPPGSAAAAESSPVISNVISLAGVLVRPPIASSSAQYVSTPDIQTKVVGHAGVQTAPKEMKNKATLCTPLVHNKGVSCTTTTQTVDTEAQTDNIVPRVLPVPVPVPPTPLGLPLPLPVPIFLPVKQDGPDPTLKSTIETIHPDPVKEEQNLKRKDKLGTEEGQIPESPPPEDPHSSDTRKQPPLLLDVGKPSEPQPELPPPAAASPPPTPLEMREGPQRSLSSRSPALVPPVAEQTVVKVHKNKGHRLQQLSKANEKKLFQRHLSKKCHKLKSHVGIVAWKRWIQWRRSQTNLYFVASHAVALNEDVLRCSATELSDGLCYFISEVKRPDGKPYSPDSLFYLCLSIQQYLFENNRVENIFSDLNYSKFSEEFTKILKGFKPSVTASGYVRSRVEEEFLWECRQLGAYSPIVLLNTLLFFCCKFFGFTAVEQHRQLSFAHVMRCTKTNPDHTKTTFLRFYPPLSINETESDTDGVPVKKRKKNDRKEEILEMMENTSNSLRCPVRLYEFYLSKCSESVRQSTDLFYLHPEQSCTLNSPLWFSSAPLNDCTMEAMLFRILAVRELQGDDGRRAVDQQVTGDAAFFPEDEQE